MNNVKIIWNVHSLGKQEGENEDAHAEYPHLGLFLIADGMGGIRRGSLASHMATEIISRTLDSTSLETESTWLFEKKESLSLEENFLRMAFLHANAKIMERATQEAFDHEMGCSALALFLIENKLIIHHVGICRAYLFRKGMLSQITEDHSLAHHRKWFPYRASQNIPLNFLGKSSSIDIDQSLQIMPKERDLFVLLTPGVVNALSHEEITIIINENINNISSLSNIMVHKAQLKNPGQDKTALILSISRPTD